MTQQYTLKKSIYLKSWVAETEVVLQKLSETSNQVLRISTCKRSSGLSTHASVGIADTATGSFSCMVFQDFSKTILHEPKARCTDKTVTAMHLQALAKIEEIKAAAIDHQTKIAAEELHTMKEHVKMSKAECVADLRKRGKAEEYVQIIESLTEDEFVHYWEMTAKVVEEIRNNVKVQLFAKIAHGATIH